MQKNKILKYLKTAGFIISIALLAAAMYTGTNNPVLTLILLVLSLILLPFPDHRYGFIIRLFAAVLVVIYGYFVWIPEHSIVYDYENDLTVHFIDTGQSESELIILPDGKIMLIDAGDFDDGPLVSSYLKSLNITKIDYLIGTHPHMDHIGGMYAVFDDFIVENVYMGYYPEDIYIENPWSLQSFNTKTKAEGKTVITISQGDVICENEEYKAEVVSPSRTFVSEDLNQYSAIIKITYGKTAFLFTGDAGRGAELAILDQNLKSDVLKVGHHGSYDATSDEFLDEVDPEYAVISVGWHNEYGLPNVNVLTRLHKRAETFRTDYHGTIIIVSDGNQITDIIKEREYHDQNSAESEKISYLDKDRSFS